MCAVAIEDVVEDKSRQVLALGVLSKEEDDRQSRELGDQAENLISRAGCASPW